MNSTIKCITKESAEYPALLAQIHEPPEELFVRGELHPDTVACAVVGTRKPSAYGAHMASRIAEDLARAGVTVVSGLAYGIDTEAHKAALEAGGITIAVLGSGVDDASIYPSENKMLARKIIECGGALVSEHTEGTGPKPWHFPARNRIIAGMSRGVVVVEAPRKSGALITADIALRENREIFAVPGQLTSENSFGPNRLIQMGAKLVMNADDILEEFGIASPELSSKISHNLTEEEKKIVALIQEAPIHIDEIAEKTGYDMIKLTAALTIMELDGKIKNLGGGLYGV